MSWESILKVSDERWKRYQNQRKKEISEGKNTEAVENLHNLDINVLCVEKD